MNAMNNVWKLYGARFFQSLIPAYVIERLFWEQRGMTIEHVVYTEILYAVTIVLLEVPTGILADRFGRKKLVVLAAALGCAEFLILLYAQTFWHFAAVVVLAGIASAASSGSENALLYDSLRRHGRERQFEQKLGRLNGIDFGAAILAALSGGWLAGRFDLELNYWLSLIGAVAGLGFALSLAEPPVSAEEKGEAIPIRRYVAEAWRFFRSRGDVRLVLVAAMVVGASFDYVDEFWQLYLDRFGVPLAWFGPFSAALLALQLPGSLLADSLRRRVPTRGLLAAIVAVFALGLGFVAAGPGLAGAAALLAVCFASGVVDPLATGYLHHRIDGTMRATIDSFQSLAGNGVAMVVGLGFGWCSARWDVFGGYGFIAVLCAAFLLYFLPASRRIQESGRFAAE
ncbi:MFS transporter [Paenibacillus sp.]|uniref:MFS transporter n=1 Tax=Paenibacillus sp. TaxID=58172 RepID=UPI002811A59D|nr:MFS transporter [Paenibacillus sp.]